MSDFGNKEVFSENLLRYIDLSGKSRRTIISDLGFKESSFNCWCRGEYYPRIDKIEMLADYFGCSKSDLIERKTDATYVIDADTKKRIEIINSSKAKRDLEAFILTCSEKDARILLSLAKSLKEGEENE